MKPYTWLMSKILSPGAFAVWHSMGDPEEWKLGSDALVHRTGLSVNTLDWRRGAKAGVPRVIGIPVVAIVGPFVFDCEGDYRGAIGYLDRQLIAGRAFRLMAKLYRKGKKSGRNVNRAVFALLTVNERVKT